MTFLTPTTPSSSLKKISATVPAPRHPRKLSSRRQHRQPSAAEAMGPDDTCFCTQEDGA